MIGTVALVSRRAGPGKVGNKRREGRGVSWALAFARGKGSPACNPRTEDGRVVDGWPNRCTGTIIGDDDDGRSMASNSKNPTRPRTDESFPAVTSIWIRLNIYRKKHEASQLRKKAEEMRRQAEIDACKQGQGPPGPNQIERADCLDACQQECCFTYEQCTYTIRK